MGNRLKIPFPRDFPNVNTSIGNTSLKNRLEHRVKFKYIFHISELLFWYIIYASKYCTCAFYAL